MVRFPKHHLGLNLDFLRTQMFRRFSDSFLTTILLFQILILLIWHPSHCLLFPLFHTIPECKNLPHERDRPMLFSVKTFQNYEVLT